MARNELSIQGKYHVRLIGWKYSSGIRLLLFVALGILFYTALAGKLVPETFDIQPDTVSEKTIRAPHQIENFDATEKAKEEAAQKVAPVYRIVSTKNNLLVDTIYTKLDQINADAEMTFEVKVNLYKNVFPSVMNDYVNGLTATLSTNSDYNDTFLDEVKKRMSEQQYKLSEESYYKLPRLTKDELKAMGPVTQDIVDKLMNDQITDAQTARAKVAEMVNASTLTKNTSRELVQEIVQFALTPNKFFDAKATDAARAAARENTKPVIINQNDVLVEKGETITPELYQRLARLDLLKDNVGYGPQIGLALISLLLVFVLYMFVRQSKLPISGNNSLLLMFALVFLIEASFLRIFALGESLGYPHTGFLAPVATGAMMIAILLDAPLAWIASVIFSVMAGVIFNNDNSVSFSFMYGFTALSSCFAAIFGLHKASQRATILKAGLLTSLVAGTAVVAMLLVENHTTLRDVLFAICFAAGGGLITAVFVIGLLPFFETAFGILSPLKLIELSNPNHPLLRKLLTETPGTYHHSVMVGNLSEAAAEAIGADGLLCRVGSYYHDIGKTKRPSYFIENQSNIENPHDRIDPALSKSIIIAHSRDGVELQKEFKIPKPLRDIAEQHHGTTLLKYFYHKAKQLAGEDAEVSEADYRYPGPKAQSKEAAIVGISDCVEAAVRSLRNPTVEQIDIMVQKIIKDRLDDGQFNECDLTLRELETVSKALKETLLGIFHSRIAYPADEITKPAKEA